MVSNAYQSNEKDGLHAIQSKQKSNKKKRKKIKVKLKLKYTSNNYSSQPSSENQAEYSFESSKEESRLLYNANSRNHDQSLNSIESEGIQVVSSEIEYEDKKETRGSEKQIDDNNDYTEINVIERTVKKVNVNQDNSISNKNISATTPSNIKLITSLFNDVISQEPSDEHLIRRESSNKSKPKVRIQQIDQFNVKSIPNSKDNLSNIDYDQKELCKCTILDIILQNPTFESILFSNKLCFYQPAKPEVKFQPQESILIIKNESSHVIECEDYQIIKDKIK